MGPTARQAALLVVLAITLVFPAGAHTGTKPGSAPTRAAVAHPAPASEVLAEESATAPLSPAPLAPSPTPRPDWGPAPRAGVTVPILMYHYIRVNPDPADRLGFGLSVTPANFAEQMDALARNGFHPITVDDLAGALRGTNGLPSRPVVLTFDDGYADFYTNAAPMLRAHNFPATAYVITGKVGTVGYLSWAQIEELDQWGFELAAHTVHHVPLARQPPAAAVAEIRQSKSELEAHLHHPVAGFAYPYGDFNAAVETEVRAAGFTNAVSTLAGSFHTPTTLFRLHRIGVTGRDNLTSFLRKLG